MTAADWILSYDKPETGKRSYGQESLMTLGNGYIGWRGAPVWSKFSEDHYPGLYAAGVFNRTTTKVAGHDVDNEDMVNLPNPQFLQFYVNGRLIDLAAAPIISRKSQVNFHDGSQQDAYVFKIAEGQLTLETTKYVDPINFHCFGFEGSITLDFPARLVVESFIDGSVLNQNVERYRAFDSKEFDVQLISGNLLLAKTRTTAIKLVLGAKTVVNGFEAAVVENVNPELLLEKYELDVQAGAPVSLSKVVALATSYEAENPEALVASSLPQLSLETIKAHSAAYWKSVWNDADILIESDDADLQRMVRMNIFHIRQAAQHHANHYLDASVGSRGLTGEGYRGHIFWDELFVIPYYAANDPETARDLLGYRIRRLAAAEENAKIDGEIGAMYPWQSGLLGDEQSQFIHLNPVNNKWEPDNSRRQRHVSLAIVYDLWIYVQLTGDYSILNEGGLEVLLETTKFWLNKATLGEDGRYHIEGVMGPDEFHEAYPGASAENGGIRDNAYTNLMLVWALNWLLSLPRVEGLNLTEAARKAQFFDDLHAKAVDVSRKLALYLDDKGVIAQYAGYFDLKEVDIKAYEEKYGDIHRIDRLLKAEGLSPDDYQVAKQADSLMTVYTLGAEQMAKLVMQLGYTLSENWLQVNRDYYLARTVHGSTTSRPVFAGIDVTLGNLDTALDYLTTAIGSDYYDIQGGTTAEGVHIGVMGETLEVIQNEFAGVTLRDGEVSIRPKLPESWRKLVFVQKFHGARLVIGITHGQISVRSNRELQVDICGKKTLLETGKTVDFETK